MSGSLPTITKLFLQLYQRIPKHRRTPFFSWDAKWLVARKLLRPFFQRPVVIRSGGGVRLIIGLDPVDEKIAHHMLQAVPHWYFPEEARSIERPLVLDLGAHHGFYSVLALSRYPKSRCIAIEPSQTGLELARQNLRINNMLPRARLVNAALAEHDGVGALLIRSASWAHEMVTNPIGATANTVEVATMSLSTILGNDSPAIVKCNAEGAEYALVEQFDAFPTPPTLVLMMIHPTSPRGPEWIRSQMKGFGYNERVVDPAPNAPTVHFWLSSR